MKVTSTSDHLEKLSGIVERITFHNEQNGWSVLNVSPFKEPNRLATVLIHQVQVFAGATMEFLGDGYSTFGAPHKKRLRDESRNLLFYMVGVLGFEPRTPCSQIVSLLLFEFFVSA